MRDNEASGAAGRVAFGAACATCCALPMLVLAGVVSFVTLLAGGIGAASVAAVGWCVWAVHRQRIPPHSRAARVAVEAAGVALAVGGLAAMGRSPDAGRALVSTGVAVLACAALASLTRPLEQPACPSAQLG